MKFHSNSLHLLAVVLFNSFVNSEPLRGGYEDSLQNIGGYGTGYGSRGDSGYGNEPANYDFQYEVFGGGNFFGHQESRRDQTAKGKYHVLLPDGRRQIVNYIADESGYHPTITYEVVANPFDGASGGYGGSSGGSSGGYDNSRGSSAGYGSPVSDNSLGGYSSPEQGTRYSSRIKRQFHITPPLVESNSGSTDDLVKIYKSDRNPERIFRNRRRRYSPKKAYLIVYPNLPSSSFTGQEELLKIQPSQ